MPFCRKVTYFKKNSVILNIIKQQHILIIGNVWPEPDSSAAGSRMLQLINLFRSENWEVKFASSSSKSDYSYNLNSVNVEELPIKLNDSTFDDLLKQLKPDIVLFDRFMTEEQFGWRVVENCPQAMRIVDTEDLHCLRAARQQAFKENRVFNNKDLLVDIAKREIASILRSDLSLIISEFEMDLLQSFFKVDKSLLYHIPFLLNPIQVSDVKKWPVYNERKHFISIGNFWHEPNWNSVLFLKQEIWPLIRKELKDAELHIYGAYPSQKVWDLHNEKEGFIVKGRADNALSVMQQYKVCLAPLRFGAGLKGKLIDAMLTGTPSVTTVIGAESMHGDLAWNGTVENDKEDFAKAAVSLYNDLSLWEVSQQNGINIINQLYNKENLGKQLIEKIVETQEHLEEHRSNNFMGFMLIHQSMNSTKYMSRWIEEKNKNLNFKN